jgi:hypothetical protein
VARPLLDSDDKTRLVKLLEKRHGQWLKDEAFEVSARTMQDLVVATVVLRRRDRTSVYEMEAALDGADPRIRNHHEALELALDFLDWYLGEYLGGQREVLLPLDFQPHRFGEFEVLARGDIHNEVLDELADAWLRGERPDVPRRTRPSR